MIRVICKSDLLIREIDMVRIWVIAAVLVMLYFVAQLYAVVFAMLQLFGRL